MRIFFTAIALFFVLATGGLAFAQNIDRDGNLTATAFTEIGFDPVTELKGSWYLDGNALDASSNGIDGTIYGTPTATIDRFGIEGKAMHFNGSTDYITVGASTRYRTFSAWVRTTSTATQAIGAGFLGTDYYVLGLESSRFCISSGGAGTGVGTQNTYNMNTWYHVVVARTDSVYPDMFKIFVNGQEQALTPVAYQRVSFFRVIGARYYSSSYTLWFQGQIDDVRVFDRILTSDEVLAMYNSERDAVKFRKGNDGGFNAPWFVEGDSTLPVQMRAKKESLTVKGQLIE